ncbi:MAG: GNAT family N-acetyltransferase [Alphaproteobacteria bacterium]
MRELRGDRVRLRPLAEADLPRTRAWRNRDEIRRWFRTSEPIGAAQHAAWWERHRERDDDFVWIVELSPPPPPPRPVGMVSLYGIDEARGEAEFGRLLVGEPDAAGRGLATEATRLVAEFAQGELGLARVHLEVAAGNATAIAVYERCGFVRESGDDAWVVMARTATRPRS